ncbi:MAG: hypothetical protein ACNA71_07545 [Kiritimatiellia bacterium]
MHTFVIRKHMRVWLLAAILAVLHVGVHWRSGSLAEPPALPDEAVWFAVDQAGGSSLQQVRLVEGDTAIALLQQRWADLGPDMRLRQTGFADYGTVAPPPLPPSRLPRQAAEADADYGLGASGLFPASPRERSGWGWLADDVQQMRGSDATGAGGTGAIELPRRFGDGDGGFRTRRWLDE